MGTKVILTSSQTVAIADGYLIEFCACGADGRCYIRLQKIDPSTGELTSCNPIS
jgi:hypothetical protein